MYNLIKACFLKTLTLPGPACVDMIFEERALGNEEGAEAIQSALFCVLRHLRTFEEGGKTAINYRGTNPGSGVTNDSQWIQIN